MIQKVCSTLAACMITLSDLRWTNARMCCFTGILAVLKGYGMSGAVHV